MKSNQDETSTWCFTCRTTKKAFVVHDDGRKKVNYKNFDNLIKKTRTKFNISSGFYLRYQVDDRKWKVIHNDDDLEDVSPETELRLVLKSK